MESSGIVVGKTIAETGTVVVADPDLCDRLELVAEPVSSQICAAGSTGIAAED